MKSKNQPSGFFRGLFVILLTLITSYSFAQSPTIDSSAIQWEYYDFASPRNKIYSSPWFKNWYIPVVAIPPIIYFAIKDTEDEVILPPTITCIPDQTLIWEEEVPPPNPLSVLVINDCPDGEITVIHIGDNSNNGSGCSGDPLTIERTYQAQDACGNSAMCVQTFTYLTDDQAPTLSCPPDLTLQWGVTIPVADVNELTANDNCTPVDEITLSHQGDEDNGGNGCSGDPRIVQRTYLAQDACGNETSCIQTFNFAIDDQAPTLNCPPDLTLQWGEAIPVADVNELTANDNCTPVDEITLSHQGDEDNGGNGCSGDPRIVQRTYLAQDACGNETSCIQTFNFAIDDQAPTLNCPPDLTLQWGEAIPVADVNELTANDNCTPVDEITLSHQGDEDNGGNGCSGDPRIVQRTYLAQDACGNETSCIQTFTFAIDDQAPTLSCPPDLTLQWGEAIPVADVNELTANDNCTPVDEITLSHQGDEDNGGNGCSGDPRIVQRTYLAQDACGNETSCIQTFTFAIDDQAPTLSCPPDLTLQWGEAIPVADVNELTANDNCTPVDEITLSHQGDEDNGGSGCSGDPRIVQRTYLAQDACGNETSCIQTFSFAIDDQAPTLSCPPDLTLECSDNISPSNTGEAIATDNCTPDPEITIDYEDDFSGLTGCNTTGSIVRTWTATDNCGNASTCTQSINLEDSTSPVFFDMPLDITVECTDIPPPFGMGASDNCMFDASPSITLDEVIGNGCPYNITRTWTATDECGNASVYSQIITVEDNTAPVINCPVDAIVICGESTDPITTGAPLISDNCSSVNFTYTDDLSNQTGCTGFIIRTFETIDDCGNQSTCEQIINIVDTGCDFNPMITIDDAECSIPDGAISIDPMAGFIYNWSNGESGPVINDLSAGTYTVTIINADLSCSQILPVDVPPAPPYDLTVVNINHPTSMGANDGSVELMIDDPFGFPPYIIFLNGSNNGTTSSTSFTIDNLSAGTYTIQVVNATGCPSEEVMVELIDGSGLGFSEPEPVWLIDMNPNVLSTTNWNELHEETFEIEQVFENLNAVIEHPPLPEDVEMQYVPGHNNRISGGVFLNPDLLWRAGFAQYSGMAYAEKFEDPENHLYLESRFDGLQFYSGLRRYLNIQQFKLFVGVDVYWKELTIENSRLIFNHQQYNISDAYSEDFIDFGLNTGLQFPVGNNLDVELELFKLFNIKNYFGQQSLLPWESQYLLDLKYRF